MSLPIFIGSKIEKDPQNFIDEMWKILKAMHTIELEGIDLVSYQLKFVPNVWYNQQEESRGEDAKPAMWDEFEKVFLDHFIPKESREVKVEKFMNLKQDGMTMKEQISIYAPEMVTNEMSKIRKFVFSLGKYTKKECKA